MQNKVTIIIPNYNGLHFMSPCFEALSRQTYRAYEVLVIDNGSTDGSVEWLKENRIPAIFLESNSGFTGAVNIGIRVSSTPYVILLNNDTEVDSEFVGELVHTMDRSPKIFSAGSKMIQLHHKELMDDAGDMYSLLGWAYQRGVGHSSKGYNRPCRIFSACAGAAIYRRSVFEEIGSFDPMHFAYLEDLDVGYRARIYGFDNVYCPKAIVYHVGSGTSGSKYNSFKVRLAARNNVYLNYKNMPLMQLLINLLPISIGIGLKYQFFKNLGFGQDYLEGLKEGFKTARRCHKVMFQAKNMKHYIAVECELIAGTFLYVYEFSKRRLKSILERRV